MPMLNLPDGYYDLPPGQMANVATFLELRALPDRPLAVLPGAHTLQRVDTGDLAVYRAVFRSVGEDLMWFSRLFMADPALSAILADPAIDSLVLMAGQERAGLLELDFRDPGTCELAFFGLVKQAQGQGLGRALLDTAITRAFAPQPGRKPVERLWVHTCTFDGAAALPTYLKAGFQPYARKVELHRDPRATGHLPRSASPHVPMLE